MKEIILTILFTCTAFGSAERTTAQPLNAIESFGSLTISDGSSFYTFEKEHGFKSGPMAPSGRTLGGHWIWNAENNTFTVIAKRSWMNSNSITDGFNQIMNDRSFNGDFYRITFAIYYIQGPMKVNKEYYAGVPSKISRSYFLINEMVKLPPYIQEPREIFLRDISSNPAVQPMVVVCGGKMPRLVPYTKDITVGGVISATGGVSDYSKTVIYLIRNEKTIKVDLTPTLLPWDIVYIPAAVPEHPGKSL